MKHHHCAEKPEKPVKTKQQRKRNPKKDTTNATTESDANGEKTEAVSASADKKSDANKMHPCHLCTVGHFFYEISENQIRISLLSNISFSSSNAQFYESRISISPI